MKPALSICTPLVASMPLRYPIPIWGYLDDLVFFSLEIVLLSKIIRSNVLLECRAKAAASAASKKPKNWIAGAIIIGIWIGLIFIVASHFFRQCNNRF